MNKLYIADVGTFAYKGRSTGHYIPLAQNYIDVLCDEYDVIVAGGPAYKEAFSGNRLLELPYNNPSNSWRDKIHLFKNCIKLFKEAKGETIVLQQSSITTAFIGIGLFYHKKSKLYVIEYSSSSINNAVKRFFYNLAKNKIDGILCPNEEVGKAFGRPYCVIPDYIYAGDKKNEQIPFENKKYDFCIVGRLAPEKGAVEVARLFAGTDVKLLIAGRPQTAELGEELERICKDADNIELHLGFIERDDYERYMRESKYALLNYQGEYSVRSSGVVYDTLFSGVPVIGQRCKALQFVEDYSCGVLYDDITSFKPELILQQEIHANLLGGIESYRQSHLNYKNRLTQFLKK